MDSTQQTISNVGKAISLFLLVVTIFFGIKAVQAFKGGDDMENQRTISVTGEGEVMAVPDIAEINITVRQESKTMAEAQKVINEKIAKALDVIRAQGVDDKDIKTQQYSSYPVYETVKSQVRCLSDGYCPPYDGGKQVISGYQASQSVTIKVRDTEKVSTLIDGLGKAGITEISGPNYTIDDEDALSAEARKAAIDDARAKAKVLAKDLGVSLGKVVSFQENGGNYPMYYSKAVMNEAMDSAGSAPAPELPKGENKIQSNVTITFRIR